MRSWSSSTYFQPCARTRLPGGAKTDSNSGGSICLWRPRVAGARYRARSGSLRLYKKRLIASPRDRFCDGVLARWRRVVCWLRSSRFCPPDPLLHDAVRAPHIVDCGRLTSSAGESSRRHAGVGPRRGRTRGRARGRSVDLNPPMCGPTGGARIRGTGGRASTSLDPSRGGVPRATRARGRERLNP